MALRTANVTITREGRDKGKTFLITEMPAQQAEEWFMRAMMLLARSGSEVPPDILSHDAASFAAMGAGAMLTGLSKAAWFEVKPLLDEMMNCVSYVTPTGSPISGAMVASQIEEVSTRIQLREEVLSLHLGFSLRDRLSELRRVASAVMTINSSNIETSPNPLQ